MATFSTTYNPDRGIDVQRHNPRFGANGGTVEPRSTAPADPTPTKFKRDIASRWAASCVRTENPMVRECLQRDLARFVGWYLVRWQVGEVAR